MSGTDEQAGKLIDAAEGDKGKTGDATHDNAEKDTPKFTQAQFEAELKDRLAREKRKGEEATNKARQEVEAAALAEQGKFKELHEKTLAQLKEYEPYKERAERYEAALKKQLEQARKGLGPAALKLLDRLDPAEQLEFIAENAEELMPTKAAPNGVGSNPAGSTGKGLTTEEQQKRSAGMRRAVRGF